MKDVLILEDSPERIKAFKAAMDSLHEASVFFWDTASEMVAALPDHLHKAVLISLDYDLVPNSTSTSEPGTGLDVCRYLATVAPVCPVLLHTSNEEAVWPMLFELGRTEWETEWLRHDLIGELWIGRLWLPKVKSCLEKGRAPHPGHHGPAGGPTNLDV